MSTAYFLVAHGSRDPRPQLALEQVAQQLRSTSSINPSLIGTGSLECAPLSLSQQLQQFAAQVSLRGIQEIQILPLFLLPGVHVKEDIPVEVAMAQQILGVEITLQVLPYLGSQVNQITTLLTTQMQSFAAETWILIAHGSRRYRGNQPIEQLAKNIGATPAYWSIPPHLSEQVEALIQQGYTQIGILPYFLFMGGITDAIVQSFQQLTQQFNPVKFYLIHPFAQTITLTHLVQTLIKSDPKFALKSSLQQDG